MKHQASSAMPSKSRAQAQDKMEDLQFESEKKQTSFVEFVREPAVSIADFEMIWKRRNE